MKDVDAEYYGYRDEDDGVLLPLEAQYEKQGTSCGNAAGTVGVDLVFTRSLCLLWLFPVCAAGVKPSQKQFRSGGLRSPTCVEKERSRRKRRRASTGSPPKR